MNRTAGGWSLSAAYITRLYNLSNKRTCFRSLKAAGTGIPGKKRGGVTGVDTMSDDVPEDCADRCVAAAALSV